MWRPQSSLLLLLLVVVGVLPQRVLFSRNADGTFSLNNDNNNVRGIPEPVVEPKEWNGGYGDAFMSRNHMDNHLERVGEHAAVDGERFPNDERSARRSGGPVPESSRIVASPLDDEDLAVVQEYLKDKTINKTGQLRYSELASIQKDLVEDLARSIRDNKEYMLLLDNPSHNDIVDMINAMLRKPMQPMLQHQLREKVLAVPAYYEKIYKPLNNHKNRADTLDFLAHLKSAAKSDALTVKDAVKMKQKMNSLVYLLREKTVKSELEELRQIFDDEKQTSTTITNASTGESAGTTEQKQVTSHGDAKSFNEKPTVPSLLPTTPTTSIPEGTTSQQVTEVTGSDTTIGNASTTTLYQRATWPSQNVTAQQQATSHGKVKNFYEKPTVPTQPTTTLTSQGTTTQQKTGATEVGTTIEQTSTTTMYQRATWPLQGRTEQQQGMSHKNFYEEPIAPSDRSTSAHRHTRSSTPEPEQSSTTTLYHRATWPSQEATNGDSRTQAPTTMKMARKAAKPISDNDLKPNRSWKTGTNGISDHRKNFVESANGTTTTSPVSEAETGITGSNTTPTEPSSTTTLYHRATWPSQATTTDGSKTQAPITPKMARKAEKPISGNDLKPDRPWEIDNSAISDQRKNFVESANGTTTSSSVSEAETGVSTTTDERTSTTTLSKWPSQGNPISN